MMVAQIAHRLPQILLALGAEDLGGGALVLGIGSPEENPAPPTGVVGSAHGQADGDIFSFEFDGGEFVNDCFACFENAISRGVCAHAQPSGWCVPRYRQRSLTQYENGPQFANG